MRIRTQLRLTMAIAFGVVLLVAGLAWQSVNAANEAGAEQERSRTVARHATALLLLTQEYPRYFEERVAQQWRERHSALVVELSQATLSGPEWAGLGGLAVMRLAAEQCGTGQQAGSEDEGVERFHVVSPGDADPG